MRISSSIVIFFLAIGIFLNNCKKEEAPISITGAVRDANGQPVPDVLVEALSQPSNFQTKTDQSGNYELGDLPFRDYYVVKASKPGYANSNKTVKFDKDENKQQVDFILNATQPYLSLSQKTFTLDGSPQDIAITIESNVKWEIQGNISWIQYNPKSGEGNSGLIINVQGFNETAPRVGELTITGDGVASQTISIAQQDVSLRLIDHTGLQESPDPSDSIFLLFDKPITVNSIASAEPFYLLDNEYTYLAGNYGFKFHCPYDALGGVFGFKYSVKGVDGKNLEGIIYIEYYNRRVALPGAISTLILTPDNKTIFAVTSDPFKLVEVDVEEATIKNEYDIPDRIYQIFLNPYNNLLYMVPPEKHYISVYNPQNGTHVKDIHLVPDSVDHPAYPSIYPVNVAFGSNGYGIVTLRNEFAGFQRFKVIDSTKDDELSIYYPIPGTESRPLLTQVTFDGKKILMLDAYGAARIQILDTDTHELTDQELQPSDLMSSFRAGRVSNKVFVGGLYKQGIFDLDTKSQIGSTSGLSLLDEESVDFTYNPLNDSEVYCLIPFNNQFEVLDYKQGITLYSGRVNLKLENLIATTDQKSIIASWDDQLMFISTDTFK